MTSVQGRKLTLYITWTDQLSGSLYKKSSFFFFLFGGMSLFHFFMGSIKVTVFHYFTELGSSLPPCGSISSTLNNKSSSPQGNSNLIIHPPPPHRSQGLGSWVLFLATQPGHLYHGPGHSPSSSHRSSPALFPGQDSTASSLLYLTGPNSALQTVHRILPPGPSKITSLLSKGKAPPSSHKSFCTAPLWTDKSNQGVAQSMLHKHEGLSSALQHSRKRGVTHVAMKGRHMNPRAH